MHLNITPWSCINIYFKQNSLMHQQVHSVSALSKKNNPKYVHAVTALLKKNPFFFKSFTLYSGASDI